MATSADRQQDASPGSTVTSARADTAQGAEAVEAVESVGANDAIEALEAAETAGDTDEARGNARAPHCSGIGRAG